MLVTITSAPNSRQLFERAKCRSNVTVCYLIYQQIAILNNIVILNTTKSYKSIITHLVTFVNIFSPNVALPAIFKLLLTYGVVSCQAAGASDKYIIAYRYATGYCRLISDYSQRIPPGGRGSLPGR